MRTPPPVCFGFRCLTKSTEFACRIRVHDAETWGPPSVTWLHGRGTHHHQIRSEFRCMCFFFLTCTWFPFSDEWCTAGTEVGSWCMCSFATATFMAGSMDRWMDVVAVAAAIVHGLPLSPLCARQDLGNAKWLKISKGRTGSTQKLTFELWQPAKCKAAPGM